MHQASEEWGFDFDNCFVIGDKASDIELGKRLGATTLLVRTGYGTQVERDGTAVPDHVINGLVNAPGIIRELLKPMDKHLIDKIDG